MNNLKITIIDYGVGNLYSVKRALEVCGGSNICISSNPSDILDADRVILPGVGAFGDGMLGLKKHNLVEPILTYAALGRPLLGICLGMQLLSSFSTEFGTHQGLNLIHGHVLPIPSITIDKQVQKVPFIGWSSLDQRGQRYSSNNILSPLDDRNSVYLIHSFHVIPSKLDDITATYHYGGHSITAAIRRNNIYGLQFHPEKSASVGLEILRSFIFSL
jgi:glutamine amidotransferase